MGLVFSKKEILLGKMPLELIIGSIVQELLFSCFSED